MTRRRRFPSRTAKPVEPARPAEPARKGRLRPEFWARFELDELNAAEWEALCDGCGRCCLLKLENDETGEVRYTNVACRLLDPHSCRCTRYKRRKRMVPACITLTTETIAESADWMPETCAYRLRHEGKPLPSWHYLVCGDTEAVHRHGMSVRGKVHNERDVAEEDLEKHVAEVFS